MPKVETFCNNEYCPPRNACANFSTDPRHNLVEYEFEIIEREPSCDMFEEKKEEQYG